MDDFETYSDELNEHELNELDRDEEFVGDDSDRGEDDREVEYYDGFDRYDSSQDYLDDEESGDEENE